MCDYATPQTEKHAKAQMMALSIVTVCCAKIRNKLW